MTIIVITILLAMTGGVSITSLSGRENSVAEAPAGSLQSLRPGHAALARFYHEELGIMVNNG